MPECEGAHNYVKTCSGEAKYKIYNCSRPEGFGVCAETIETPEKGLAARWQRHLDEHNKCVRCGREIRYCWSWIPL